MGRTRTRATRRLALPALLASAVAGCGVAGGDGPTTPAAGPKLTARDKRELMTLIRAASNYAAQGDPTATDKALSKFVADVGTMRRAGAVGLTTATELDSRALAAEAAAESAQQPAAVRVRTVISLPHKRAPKHHRGRHGSIHKSRPAPDQVTTTDAVSEPVVTAASAPVTRAATRSPATPAAPVPVNWTPGSVHGRPRARPATGPDALKPEQGPERTWWKHGGHHP